MSGARLKHQDEISELVPFAVPPNAESDIPGPDLGPVVAARLEDWSRTYSIPPSTLRALRAVGKGPRVFEIGRLLYCTRDDWTSWLEGLAAVGGTGPLTPPAGRFGRKTNAGLPQHRQP
jgi:hypothetical protein